MGDISGYLSLYRNYYAIIFDEINETKIKNLSCIINKNGNDISHINYNSIINDSIKFELYKDELIRDLIINTKIKFDLRFCTRRSCRNLAAIFGNEL